MIPQHFRVEEQDLPGEQVSGTMDERPELDRGRLYMTKDILIYRVVKARRAARQTQPNPEGLGHQ
jgi:hypothetical protein